MGIFHYVHFNFCVYYFDHDTVQDTFCPHFTEFTPIVYIHWHFCTASLYWTHCHQTLPGFTGQFQAPVPKAQDNKPKKYRQQPLSVLPPRDVYLNENQARHTLVIRNDSLPTPSSAK